MPKDKIWLFDICFFNIFQILFEANIENCLFMQDLKNKKGQKLLVRVGDQFLTIIDTFLFFYFKKKWYNLIERAV